MLAALVLLVAIPSAPREAQTPDWVVDLEFVRSQEDSIHSFKEYPRLEEVMSLKDAAMIRRLGCGKYASREECQRKLEGRGIEVGRILQWGTWSKDQEIAARCRKSLDKLYVCKNCGGTGKCPSCASPKYDLKFEEIPYDPAIDPEADSTVLVEGMPCPVTCLNKRCVHCDGSGDYRYDIVNRWTDDGWKDFLVERKILPGKVR